MPEIIFFAGMIAFHICIVPIEYVSQIIISKITGVGAWNARDLIF